MSIQTEINFRETKRCLRPKKSINYVTLNDSGDELIKCKGKASENKSRKQRQSKRIQVEPESDDQNKDKFVSLGLSPPKLKCADRENKNLLSPTSLISKLNLCTEVSTKSIYQKAKEALNNTIYSDMPCRENEVENITNTLESHLKEKSSCSIYISGPPGTGKTATLTNILKYPQFSSGYKQAYINCACIKSSQSIYIKIADCLKISSESTDVLNSVENYLAKSKKMTLLILDEIDQLETRKQEILYTIFEWPARLQKSVVLIGIANALDLTDRILPRLQAHTSLKPKLVHFAPYKKQDIVEIFTRRLRDADVEHIFAPMAIQMLAGKVAAVSGDVRRALDIGRRAIEITEQARTANVLQPTTNENNADTLMKNKQVGLKEVMTVLNNIFSSAQQLCDSDNEILPLQQKIVLCSLILMLKKGRTKDVSVGKLHDVYKRVCDKRNISAVDQVEFKGLLSLIESRGILKVGGRKEFRFQKVTLEWDEEEVSSILQDKQLMASILDDVTCLGLKN